MWKLGESENDPDEDEDMSEHDHEHITVREVFESVDDLQGSVTTTGSSL